MLLTVNYGDSVLSAIKGHKLTPAELTKSTKMTGDIDKKILELAGKLPKDSSIIKKLQDFYNQSNPQQQANHREPQPAKLLLASQIHGASSTINSTQLAFFQKNRDCLKSLNISTASDLNAPKDYTWANRDTVMATLKENAAVTFDQPHHTFAINYDQAQKQATITVKSVRTNSRYNTTKTTLLKSYTFNFAA